MASTKNSQFAEDLDGLLAAHPEESDQLLIRYALMWLFVAERPLRASELWIALQVQESKSLEEVERLVVESEFFDEEMAAAGLRGIMGSIINISSPEANSQSQDPAGLYVSLADAGLKSFLLDPDSNAPDMLFFQPQQAHTVVTSVCMVICSVTCIHLMHIHDTDSATGLILYAWTHWAKHFQLSRSRLNGGHLTNLFEGTAFRICTDTLVFLLKLKDILTGPVERTSREDPVATILKVQNAQIALDRPMSLLSALVQMRYTSSLYNAWRSVSAVDKDGTEASSTGEQLLAPLMNLPRSSTSKLLTLKVDSEMRPHRELLGQTEKQVVQAFADVARELRAVAARVADARLDVEFRDEFGKEAASPYDVLFHTAAFMESIASFPLWNFYAPFGAPPTKYFEIADTSDELYAPAAEVLNYIRLDDSVEKPQRTGAREHIAKSGLSSDSWLTATAKRLAVTYHNPYKDREDRGSIYVINGRDPLSQRTTSFALLADNIQQPSTESFVFLNSILPNSLKAFARRTIMPILNYVSQSSVFSSTDEFLSGALTGGSSGTWPAAKAAIMMDGYLYAVELFMAASGMYLLTRMIAPWLGRYVIYGHPVADLSVAFTNPLFLIAKHLAPSWFYICLMSAQKFVFDLVCMIALGIIASNEGRLPETAMEPIRPYPRMVFLFVMAFEICKVLWLLWCIIAVEYMFTRATETIAVLVAYWKIFFGSDEDHIIIGRLMKVRWDKVLFNGYLVVQYARQVLWPISYMSILTALMGQVGTFLVISVTSVSVAAMVKWPGQVERLVRYGSFLLVAGFIGLVCILLSSEFLEDPLGLKKTTRDLKWKGMAARKVVPGNGMARSIIFKNRVACPLELPEVDQPAEEGNKDHTE